MPARPGLLLDRALPLMKDLSDILEGCRKNDRICQEKLYRQFYPAMFSLCKKFFTDSHQIQTCLNNGMLRVFKNLDQYNSSKGEFFNWMYTIVRNSCLTGLREANRKSFEIVMEEIPELSDNEEENFAEYESIIDKIDILPQATRAIFILFYIENFSIKDIRDQLNISDGTVKWHLNQGRNRLKQHLTQS